MIRIVVEGPKHAGKGHVIALIAHHMKEAGINVKVQGEYGHNANKMIKMDEDLIKRLAEIEIHLMGMQTSQ